MEPKPSKNVKLIVLYSLLGICVAATAFFAYGTLHELYVRWQGKAYYASLAATVQITDPHESAATLRVRVNFAALREQIPDLVAWIKGEGIGMDFPIVQGRDNDYYLHHLPTGEANYMGAIFLDYRDAADFSDKNSLVYGHALASGDMFTVIKKYMEPAFYNEHPEMTLYTPDQEYTLVLFAGYVLDSSIKSEVPPIAFADEDAFMFFLKEAKRRSTFKSSVEVTADDTLVTLATCAYPSSVYRYVLIGKLVAN